MFSTNSSTKNQHAREKIVDKKDEVCDNIGSGIIEESIYDDNSNDRYTGKNTIRGLGRYPVSRVGRTHIQMRATDDNEKEEVINGMMHQYMILKKRTNTLTYDWNQN